MARNDTSAPLQPAPQSRSGSGSGKKRGLNPMFIGIIIGLLLGVGLALGLAIWLNRANNPFIEKTQPVEALQAMPARSLQPQTPPHSSAPGGKGDAEKPRFEFYQILPGEKNEKSSEKRNKPDVAAVPKAAEPAHKVVPETKPAATTDGKIEIKPASSEVFYLQAGAFQNQSDAENVKAKVAFAGFEAAVRPVNLPDKGTLYRVRLGPYKSLDEVNRIKTALSQGGIGAAVVKGSD